MPVITVHGAKGGQGTTTVAAVLAILHAHAGHRTLLVDTAGDLPAILATNDHDRAGLAEYLNPAHRLAVEQVTTNVADRLDLIASGDGTIQFDTYTYGLLTGGLDHYDTVIVDTATHAPAWDRHADSTILVTQPCYLALRRAVTQPRPTHLAVITEPGRALNTTDIEAALGIPITATIPLDADIARSIDAGLLNTRIPGPSPEPSALPARRGMWPDENDRVVPTRARRRAHHHHPRIHPDRQHPRPGLDLLPAERLPEIGPSAYLLFVMANAWLPPDDGGTITVNYDELAHSVGTAPGRLAKSLQRLAGFHLAHTLPDEPSNLYLRRRAPTLNDNQLARLAQRCPTAAACHDEQRHIA